MAPYRKIDGQTDNKHCDHFDRPVKFDQSPKSFAYYFLIAPVVFDKTTIKVFLFNKHREKLAPTQVGHVCQWIKIILNIVLKATQGPIVPTVVPTKSYSDVILCLQLLSKILMCTLHLS